MPELLNNHINKAIEALNKSFVYRKLGCCYDYRMPSENDFNLESLPKAEEINKNIPDEQGKTSGMYDCILNNCLLFDGLTYRVEIGFAQDHEYTILDRLIGGAIRLATIAPKNLIIRGLSADGRYFYHNTDAITTLLWHYTAWRIITTTTVLPVSQIKLINIANRWLNNFTSNNNTLSNHETPLGQDNDPDRLKLCAILGFKYSLTPKDNILKDFNLKFNQDFIIPDNADISELLSLNLSLNMIHNIFAENTAIQERSRVIMKEIAVKAVKYLKNYQTFDSKLATQTADPNWRNFSQEKPTVSQQKYNNEFNSITIPTQAIYIIINSRAKDIIQENTGIMTEIIANTPWNNLSLATALTAIIPAHARGVDLKIWDKELEEFISSFVDEDALVAPFLEKDYDEKNPEKFGHTEAPKKKSSPADNKNQVEKRGRKRRKRRKKSKLGPQTANKADTDRKNEATTEKDKKSNKSNQPAKNTKKKRNRKRRSKQSNKSTGEK